MNIEQVLMTPSWAAALLENNINNRNMRPRKVAEIADDISSGRWMLNPQPIAISSTGVLIDGQHRLKAIVLTNQSVPLMLANDCPPECFKTIDIGTVRTNADFFKIEGIKNAGHISPAVRFVESYKHTPHMVWCHSQLPLSKTQIHDLYLDQQSEYDAAIEIALRSYNKCKQINPGVLAALIILCPNKPKVNEFADAMGNGIGLKSTSPIYMWRQALINGTFKTPRSRGMKTSQIHMAGFIKSYNFWRQNLEIKLFKLPSIPPMPTIYEF